MRVRVLLDFAVVLAVASAADDKDGESAPDPPADDDKGESAGGDNSCQYASDGVCDEDGAPRSTGSCATRGEIRLIHTVI